MQRASYEWHIPKGILKRNWASKHLFEIPAVAVLFFEIEWDEPDFSDKCRELLQQV